MPEFELEPGEEVVREARKHWFIFLAELLPYAIMSILPLAATKILLIAPQLATYTSNITLTGPFGRTFYGIWLLVVWTGAWGTFTKYFLNAWVLTNRRIVDIKQRGFFNREVSSLFLNRVQDVTTDVVGLIPSVLSIGDIKVQTAGEDVDFVMHGIPRPEEMRDSILALVSPEKPAGGI